MFNLKKTAAQAFENIFHIINTMEILSIVSVTLAFTDSAPSYERKKEKNVIHWTFSQTKLINNYFIEVKTVT